jgi:hypothetical protein
MNIAHIESKAVPGGRKGVRSLVRRLAACCLIGVAAMSVAQAGPRDRDRDAQGQRDSYRSERNQRQPDERQYVERPQRQYDTRADDRGRRQDQQNAQNDRSQRSGRLTPDERRDLRRQINEAGADIYRARTRR